MVNVYRVKFQRGQNFWYSRPRELTEENALGWFRHFNPIEGVTITLTVATWEEVDGQK